MSGTLVAFDPAFVSLSLSISLFLSILSILLYSVLGAGTAWAHNLSRTVDREPAPARGVGRNDQGRKVNRWKTKGRERGPCVVSQREKSEILVEKMQRFGVGPVGM